MGLRDLRRPVNSARPVAAKHGLWFSVVYGGESRRRRGGHCYHLAALSFGGLVRCWDQNVGKQKSKQNRPIAGRRRGQKPTHCDTLDRIHHGYSECYRHTVVALVASFGIGGLAIALAAKESVANFLGALTIIFDKPFRIGDQILIDKYDGTVESVGFRSTRIRTGDGNLLSMPNSKIIDSPLQNVQQRANILWRTTIGISYETPPDKVRRAIEILEEILQNHEGMRQDLPPRVFFDAFKDSSLNIAIWAWYHPPNGWDYHAWLQKTCMEILERFASEGIRFALPTQVLRLPFDDKRQFELRMLKGEQTEADK